jgi:inosine triphosphate pyrophosphatase
MYNYNRWDLIFRKSFLDKVGREGLYKMVESCEDKSGYAQCIYAFCEGRDAEPVLFVGRNDGTIVVPRGENMFGWDPVF